MHRELEPPGIPGALVLALAYVMEQDGCGVLRCPPGFLHLALSQGNRNRGITGLRTGDFAHHKTLAGCMIAALGVVYHRRLGWRLE